MISLWQSRDDQFGYLGRDMAMTGILRALTIACTAAMMLGFGGSARADSGGNPNYVERNVIRLSCRELKQLQVELARSLSKVRELGEDAATLVASEGIILKRNQAKLDAANGRLSDESDKAEQKKLKKEIRKTKKDIRSNNREIKNQLRKLNKFARDIKRREAEVNDVKSEIRARKCA